MAGTPCSRSRGTSPGGQSLNKPDSGWAWQWDRGVSGEPLLRMGTETGRPGCRAALPLQLSKGPGLLGVSRGPGPVGEAARSWKERPWGPSSLQGEGGGRTEGRGIEQVQNRAGAETSRARAQVLARGFPAGPGARYLILATSGSSFVNGDRGYRLGGLLRIQDIMVMREGAQCLSNWDTFDRRHFLPPQPQQSLHLPRAPFPSCPLVNSSPTAPLPRASRRCLRAAV